VAIVAARFVIFEFVVQDASGRPLYDHSAAATLGNDNPETQRVVRLAKEREQNLATVSY
jgi:hypothetical protein